jgi:hypothetical protein
MGYGILRRHLRHALHTVYDDRNLPRPEEQGMVMSEKFNFTDLSHEVDGCQDVCQRILEIMCFRCNVNYICHRHGEVNHDQMQLCILSCMYCKNSERPMTKEDLAFVNE